MNFAERPDVAIALITLAGATMYYSEEVAVGLIVGAIGYLALYKWNSRTKPAQS